MIGNAALNLGMTLWRDTDFLQCGFENLSACGKSRIHTVKRRGEKESDTDREVEEKLEGGEEK